MPNHTGNDGFDRIERALARIQKERDQFRVEIGQLIAGLRTQKEAIDRLLETTRACSQRARSPLLDDF